MDDDIEVTPPELDEPTETQQEAEPRALVLFFDSDPSKLALRDLQIRGDVRPAELPVLLRSALKGAWQLLQLEES